jgi:hypothetical protein
MAPRMLDHLMLAYVSMLATAPHVIAHPILAPFAQIVLLSFPSVFFLIALLATMLRTLLKLERVDFGLTLTRWVVIIAILAIWSAFAYGVLRPLAEGPPLWDINGPVIPNLPALLPSVAAFLGTALVLLYTYAGWEFGPEPRPKP